MAIYEKHALIVREDVGAATDANGGEYELSTSMKGAPLVKSIKTGRTYSLGWEQIINMAITAGVNDEPGSV